MSVPGTGSGAVRTPPNPDKESVDRILNMSDADFAKEVRRRQGLLNPIGIQMATTTLTQIPPGVQAFYDRNLLTRAQPAEVHGRFGQKRPIARRTATRSSSAAIRSWLPPPRR
jgi:hypothetical protein